MLQLQLFRTQAILKHVGNNAQRTDLTYDQLRSLLADQGYVEHTTANGSDRLAFIQSASGHIVSLDRPQGREFLSQYQLRVLTEELGFDPREFSTD